MEQTKYDVFISYSRHDYVDEHENVIPNNEVSKIMKTLTDAGITYWIDKNGIYSGDKFTEELPKIIKSAPIFVYLSTANANKSKYTSKEIAIADEYGKYIIPVRIDMTPYSDKVIFRIADVSFIKYAVNPSRGREDLVKSIKAFLKKKRETELQKQEEERLRKEELYRQRKQQEEEKKRQEKIAQIETEIAALESQKTEREKIILQKEQELKLAQIDLKACETKIQKLQNKMLELRESKVKTEEDSKRHFEEKELIGERTTNKEEWNTEQKRHEGEPHPDAQEYSISGVSFKMIRVEGGHFQMGALNSDSEASGDEKPQHWVTLNDYYIGETQVTQALWQAVMGTNPSYLKENNCPVGKVSWDDCQEFLKKLNRMLGLQFSLPTEAQWEFAAKGGKKSQHFKYSGGNRAGGVSWYINNSDDKPHPVKGKHPNELGLYDMSGNVWEWCEDWYGKYKKYDQNTPKGAFHGSYRVLRGGCWYSESKYCRTTYRDKGNPTTCDISVGFRIVLNN